MAFAFSNLGLIGFDVLITDFVLYSDPLQSNQITFNYADLFSYHIISINYISFPFPPHPPVCP